MTWVYVLIGIVCLIALQSLRGALSMAFPTRSVRACARPEARQFGGLELIDETTAALKYLGFEGPAWICDEERQADIENVSYHAVYRNADKNTVAWVGPTIDVAQPSQPLFYYTTALTDGRFVVTQISDPYFSAVADQNTPARTIASSDKATELQQHLEFVESIGGAPIANVPIRDAVMRFAGEHLNSIRQRLLERGKIRESDGIARPGFLFAVDILRKFATRPVRHGANPRGVPSSRLAFLARVVRRTSERAPAQSTQWFLMLLSAFLFLVIGWPLLGLNYTVIILAVILFHEGGHWLAMKAFGYRNPHITLLPLLGGVTIGHETDPGAAKRLWVSLAGPIPGIILAWILVYFVTREMDTSLYSDWLMPTIIVLLFINYLNVLPIPPLDGSHVVKALLPPRWVFAQIVAVFLGVVIGVYVAYLLEFWPLALIAALQLFAVRSLWTDASLVRKFSRERPPASRDDDLRMEWLLEKLDVQLGTPRKAAKRIQLAQRILSQIDMRPMGSLHRMLATAVYLGLVAVPLGALAFTVLNPFSMEMSPQATAMNEEYDLQKERFSEIVQARSIDAMISDLTEGNLIRMPAGADALTLAEIRLGRALPAHLREFYLQTNGLKVIGLGKVSAISAADSDIFRDGYFQYLVFDGDIVFYDHLLAEISVPLRAIDNWWQIGHSEQEWGMQLFVDPDAESGTDAIYVVSVDRTATYPDLDSMLREYWVAEKSSAAYAAYSVQLVELANARMQDSSIEELLKHFPKPGLLQRLISGGSLPGPATESAISDVERRIGVRLPDDHRRVLAMHDGFNPMLLLAADDIQPATRAAENALQLIVDLTNGNIEGEVTLTLNELNQCWIVAGYAEPSIDASITGQWIGHILWCPDLEPARRYVSPAYGGYHSDLTSVIRHSAARLSVAY